MTAADAHPVVVWLDPEQVPLVDAIARRAGLDVVAAGSSQRARTREVAAALGPGVQPIDDIRAVLTHPDASAVILAAPSDFAASSARDDRTASDDAGLLADCRARGVPVFTFEPTPADLLQVQVPSFMQGSEGHGLVALGPESPESASSVAATGWAEFCPLLRVSGSVRAAWEVLPQLGLVRAVHVECWSGPSHGTLGARLFDAIDLVVNLLSEPDRIDASYVAPGRTRGLHTLAGESLNGLEGDLTANLRFPDGRAGAIACSNRAGRFSRTLTILGEAGRLRVYDDGFLWLDPDGKIVEATRDQSRVRGASATDDPAHHAVIAIADHIARVLDPGVPPDAPTDLLRVLATAGAALLSARTGESESPATLLRMVRSG